MSQTAQNGHQATGPDTRNQQPVEPQKNPNLASRIWQSFSRNVAPLTLIVAFIAVCGDLHGIVGFGNEVIKRFHHPPPLSYSSILNQAEGWKNSKLLNYGDGSRPSAWIGYLSNDFKATRVYAYPNFLNIHIHRYPRKENYEFFLDRAEEAILPSTGNFLLSYDINTSTGCYSGLLFDADFIANRFAFFYVTPDSQRAMYGIAVSPGAETLNYAGEDRSFEGPVDRITVVRYGNKYIFAIDAKVVRVLTSAALARLDAKLSLSGQSFGIGTITCPGKGWASYGFSLMQLRTP